VYVGGREARCAKVNDGFCDLGARASAGDEEKRVRHVELKGKVGKEKP
jgi:hypothetical protein